MLTLTGNSFNISSPIVGILTFKELTLWNQANHILYSSDKLTTTLLCRYKAYITNKEVPNTKKPVVVIDSIDNLFNEGDIIALYPDGEIKLLFRPAWGDYTFFTTNRCNSRCGFCPQFESSNESKDAHYFHIAKEALSLIHPSDLQHIGITGGEPGLFIEELCETLQYCKEAFPKAGISLLTNGRVFSDFSRAAAIAKIQHPRLLICIPLYSAVASKHNEYVGSHNAFRQTLQGIYNLHRVGQKIEVRTVIFRDNVSQLNEIGMFIYRQMPFVRHVAFMGMEYTGLAAADAERYWIDPLDYSLELQTAVWELYRRGMHASIYNHPLCILPEKVHSFARDSISTWKKTYLESCSQCILQDSCSGVFQTSIYQSRMFQLNLLNNTGEASTNEL